ncbi:MAG: peptidoglycan-binding domain-containing protein [Roseiarcus sp.]
MQRFIGVVDDEHREGHFPGMWDPHSPKEACLRSPDKASTLSAVTSPALPLDVHTISGLQPALTMLGYRIAVDGDYGAETRQVVTSFQMRSGIVPDGVAGAQTEAKLLTELNGMREMDGHLSR